MKDEKMISKKAKQLSWIFTLLYFGSYVTRIGFTVMLVKIGSAIGLSADTAKSTLAIVLTAMTITYGTGQILNGIIGDKASAANMLSIGLFVACCCNILMSFASNIIFMTVLWAINGCAQSMMWPPIVKLMSQNLSGDEYSYGMVRVSWGSSFATVFMYVLCPLLLKVISWKTVFVILAVFVLFIDIFWTFFARRLLSGETSSESRLASKASSSAAKAFPKQVFFPLVLIMLAIIMQGMLRDGVTDWMPYLLTETFRIPAEESILATVILAVFSIISFFVTDLLSRKIFREETSFSAGIFMLSGLSAALLLIFKDSSIILSLVFCSLIVACMHGINLMLITVVPRSFGKTGRISTVSGMLNACTYVGSAISTYAFARTTELSGWTATITIWIIISVAGAVFSFTAASKWKKFKENL